MKPDKVAGHRPNLFRSPYLLGGLLSVVALPLILSGGTTLGSQAATLIALGILITLYPPKEKPLNAFIVLAAALVLLGAGAWLPASWFPTPPWRSLLAEAGAVLPGTLSPQPWLSFESWILLAAGCFFFCWLSGCDWSKTERLFLLRMVAAGTILFAAVSVWFYIRKSTPAIWLGPRGFGPFPNRNQTGDVLGTGGLLTLAMAAQAWRRRGSTWPLWLGGFALVLYATIENFSRAGVGLLLGGGICWIIMAAWISANRRWLVTGASAAVILLSLFLVFGNATLQRFQTESLVENGQMLGFRGRIYRDVVHMTNVGPFCGMGLGNFRDVFPYFRVASRLEATPLHPESDWLWAASELGWGGLALLLGGVAVWVRSCVPFAADGEARCRAAAFVAFAGFLLHGIVDVSGHRLGSLLPALLMASLAMRSQPRSGLGRVGRLSFRLGGGLLTVSGIFWARPFEMKPAARVPEPLVSTVPASAKEAARVATFDAAIRADSAALRRAPLNGERYFSRGAARAGQGDWLGAMSDFRIARALQPLFIQRALAEGRVWSAVQPMLALTVWQEALDRCPPERRAATYAQILADAPAIPALRQRLRQLAGADPALQAAYLKVAAPEESMEILTAIRAADPRLETLDDAGKLAVFNIWAQSPDADAWERQMAEMPAWKTAGWRLLARRAALREDFERACQVTIDALPRPSEPPPPATPVPLGDLQRRVLLSATDFASAWQLQSRYAETGDWASSLDLLRRVCRQPDVPAYFHHALARLLAAQGDWPGAWAEFQSLL